MQPGLDQEVDHCCQTAFAEVRPCPCGSGNLTSSPIHIQSPMNRTHKSNFSAPTLHGAQSAVILGSHHPEPKSLRSSGGSRSYSRSSSSAAVAPWAALDVAKLSEEVRNRQSLSKGPRSETLRRQGISHLKDSGRPVWCLNHGAVTHVFWNLFDLKMLILVIPQQLIPPHTVYIIWTVLCRKCPAQVFFLLSAIDTIVSGCSRSAIEYPSEFAIISS